MLKLSLAKLDEFFGAIAKEQTLYLPVDVKEGQALFKKWHEGITMSNALNTMRSAKDFFFPQTENLVDFKMEGKNIEIIDNSSETEDFVVFGVRACDERSFNILDKVFLSEPVDSYYKSRREHGTVITLACSRPVETCFCQAFGIDATEPEGDAAAWIVNDELFLKANTEKGTAFIDKFKDYLTKCDDTAVKKQKTETKSIFEKLPLHSLTTDKLTDIEMMEIFNSPVWDKLSESCLGCGTCTFVCPTCQCYDIKDFDTGHGIKRYRCWDSCMYSDFTKMAHGNPRTSQLERFRQRFMHKLVYFPSNNDGEFGCVGCGRCLVKCPISMNIVKVMRQLGGNENE